MAARAMSSGTISFGLVSIPVKLYTGDALEERALQHAAREGQVAAEAAVRLRDLRRGRRARRDGARLRVRARSVRGADRGGARRRSRSKSDQSIEIEEFVPIEKVDPIYFEKSHLLGPDKGGAKAYRLLNEAMLDDGPGGDRALLARAGASSSC